MPQTSVELDPVGLEATYTNTTLMLLKWLFYMRTQRYALPEPGSAKIQHDDDAHILTTAAVGKNPPTPIMGNCHVLIRDANAQHSLLPSSIVVIIKE